MGEEQGSEDARSRSQSSCPARVFQTPWGQLLGCCLTRQVAQTGQGPELWLRMQPLSSPLKSPLAASAWLRLKGGPPDPCFPSAQSTIPGPLPAHPLQITSLNVLSPETRASSHETMKVGPPPQLPAQEQPSLGPNGKHRKEAVSKQSSVHAYELSHFRFGPNFKESACNPGDTRLIPGSGRSSGGGNGHPLQCSCLENPMDRGAWWATVCGVVKSQTSLRD